MALRVISLNCSGLGNRTKRRAIFNYYRARSEIVCLQETHCTKDKENIWRNEWRGEILFNHGTTDACGTAILLKPGIDITVVKTISDNDGRILIAQLKYGENIFSLCCLYAPNKDNPEFFIKLCKLLEMTNEHRIIVGDFNLVLTPDLDSKNVKADNLKAQKILTAYMEETLLCDIWRIRNPDKHIYSYLRNKPCFKARRLDYGLISEGMQGYMEDTFYLPGLLTDHSAFCIILLLNKAERGKSYWKFNTSHLRDQEFLDAINLLIDTHNSNDSSMDALTNWDYLMNECAKKAKSYARSKASEKELIISQLSEKLTQMLQEEITCASELDILECTKIDLDALMMEKAKGLMLCSKASWYEFEGKSSSYFFNLEKMKYNAKMMNVLLDENQEQITCPKWILERQRLYYENLYKKDDTVRFSTDGIICDRKTPESIKESQDTPFTRQEVSVAVLQLKNQKCPGCSGFPIDFFKVFWACLCTPFMDMLEEAFKQKRLTSTMLRGIINLIPKGDKDHRLLKNQRPITLLNTEYKIVEKVIANRMIPALEYVISEDQTGFLKDRRISTNI